MRIFLTLLLLSLATPLSAQISDSQDGATVEVQNELEEPVTVFMEYGQFDRRLGTVPAYGVTTLPLPDWAASQQDRISLFVHPEGGRDRESEQFLLHPGAHLGLRVRAPGEPVAPIDTMMAVLTPEEISETTLTVDNPRAQEVTVYAEHGDFDVRLGSVPAQSVVTLEFPMVIVRPDESVSITVHPENGPDLASEVLRIQEGEHLGLRVPED